MSNRHRKIVDRFLTRPKDFSWYEMVRLLEGFGYSLVKSGKTSGSVVRFRHEHLRSFTLHKPHPGNIVSPAAMKQVLKELQAGGLV